MLKAEESIGLKYGRLLVLRIEPREKGKSARCLCRCDCGTKRVLILNQLRTSRARSCGCLVTEMLRGRLIDLTGKRFGRLTVMQRGPDSERGMPRWHCKCDCGGVSVTAGARLSGGLTLSCGCLRRETASETGKKAFRHGGKVNGRETPEYSSWRSMHKRCYESASISYRWYGAKGIKVCKRWHKFENFLADMGERPLGMTLDRKDSSKDYHKSNCRWATSITQQRNRTNNKHLTYNGETLVMKAWAERYGIKYPTLKWRIAQGWPMERALGLQP